MQVNRKSETRMFFDKKAGIWANNYLDKKNPISNRSRNFYKYIKLFSKEKLKILDVGCGTGDISAYLYDKGNFLTSLDVSNMMIAKSSSRFFEKSINWVVIDESGHLPLDNTKFDVVIISPFILDVSPTVSK